LTLSEWPATTAIHPRGPTRQNHCAEALVKGSANLDVPDHSDLRAVLARCFPLALLNRLVRAEFARSHVKREERGDNPSHRRPSGGNADDTGAIS